MKRLVALISAALFSISLLQAKDDLQTNLSNLIKERVKSEIKIADSKSIKSMPGFKLVVVEVVKNGDRFPVIASDKGDFAMSYNPNGYLTSNDEFKKATDSMMKDLQAYMEKLQTKRDQEKVPKLKELFSSLPKETVIDIKGKGKATKYIVSDPECPYCRKELANIEKVLEKYNLKFIISPVHKKPAFIKGQMIYDQAKKAKNSEEIIKIMRKYFDANYQLTAQEQKVEPETVNKASGLIFQSGLVRGVPFCFEPDTGKVGCGM